MPASLASTGVLEPGVDGVLVVFLAGPLEPAGAEVAAAGGAGDAAQGQLEVAGARVVPLLMMGAALHGQGVVVGTTGAELLVC